MMASAIVKAAVALHVLFSKAAAIRLGDEERDDQVQNHTIYGDAVPPSGTECNKETWGTDSELGNADMKAYLETCMEEVMVKGDDLSKLPELGCLYKFDVVTWYDINGLQPLHRQPQSGGIYCAKVFKVKKNPPKECIAPKDGPPVPNARELFAAISGDKGPHPSDLGNLGSGSGLNKIENNYTWFTALHPRAWPSRKIFRKGMNICQKWNALDTVVHVQLLGEAEASGMMMIVGPSDANEADVCSKGSPKKESYERSKRLKALICINPVGDYVKAVDVQEIVWHPPR
eukprot:TRINITY_DN102550_c0_g1_i1.p1 TRINITY_DN102550_c0_g1~~TRINITY_DN102550_c0_g1_i1.p1  ORF type:complete len:288 (-),score=85.64 TRINITY_DN102550_c0_g1_i1:176-1039(-)